MEKKTLELDYVENEEMEDTSPREVNAKAKELLNLCKESDVPVFIAYYLAEKGYKYKALLPEEIMDPKKNLTSEYGKFAAFLRVVMDFNKADYLPQIH